MTLRPRKSLCSALAVFFLCVVDVSAETNRFVFRVQAPKEVPGNVVVDFRKRMDAGTLEVLNKALAAGVAPPGDAMVGERGGSPYGPSASVAVMKPELIRDLELPGDTRFFATTDSEYPAIVVSTEVAREKDRTIVMAKVIDGRWIDIQSVNDRDSLVTLQRDYGMGQEVGTVQQILTLFPGEQSFRVRSPKLPFQLRYYDDIQRHFSREVSVEGNDTEPLSLRIVFEDGDLTVTCADCPMVFEHRRSDSLLLLGCDGDPKDDSFSPDWARPLELRVVDEPNGRLDRYVLENNERLRYLRTTLGPTYSSAARWEIFAPRHQPPYRHSEPIDLTKSPTAIVMRLPVEGVEIQGIHARFSEAFCLDDKTPVPIAAESNRFSDKIAAAHLILPCGFQGVVRIQQKNEMEGVDVPIDLTGSQRTFTVAPKHHWNRTKPKD